MSTSQAEEIASGLVFRNTLENYAHLGLAGTQTGLATLEDIIGKVTTVLVKTGAVDSDPLQGQYTTLYYQEPLKQLKDSDFHPGKRLNIVEGLDNVLADSENIRGSGKLKELSDAEWKSLVTIGSMRMEPISFARGTARLNVQSERELSALAVRLQSLPTYYLVVVGQTIQQGKDLSTSGIAYADAVSALLVLVINCNKVALITNRNRSPVRVKALLQEHGSAVGNKSILLHLSQSQSALFCSSFGRLPCQQLDWAAGSRVDFIRNHVL